MCILVDVSRNDGRPSNSSIWTQNDMLTKELTRIDRAPLNIHPPVPCQCQQQTVRAPIWTSMPTWRRGCCNAKIFHPKHLCMDVSMQRSSTSVRMLQCKDLPPPQGCFKDLPPLQGCFEDLLPLQGCFHANIIHLCKDVSMERSSTHRAQNV